MNSQIRHHANEILRLLDQEEPIEDPISDFRVHLDGTSRVTATWTPHTGGLMDIEYYIPTVDTKWKHSVKKYRGAIDIQDGQTSIGFNEPIEKALFRAKIGDWYSGAIEVKKSNPVADPEPVTDPPKSDYIIDYSGNNIAKGEPYLGWMRSAVVHNGKVRLYFGERTIDKPRKTRVYESSDLKNWIKLPDANIRLHGVMKHNGWKAWGVEDGWMCLYESEDGIYFNRVKKAFTNWAMDTKFSMVFDPNRNQYVMFGRARGSQSPASGGFGDDLNRRGISRHKSRTSDWTGEWYANSVVCDPMDFWDYNTKSDIDAPEYIIDSKGVERKGHGLIRYDFYAPNVFFDGGYRAYPIVFYRSGNRIVDRGGATPFSDRDKVTQSRWRYTGEWKPIEMKSDNGRNWEIVTENPFKTYKETLPEPPYFASGKHIQDRFTDQPQTPMMDVAPFEFQGQKYIAISQMGRHYFQIADTKINAGIEIRKL